MDAQAATPGFCRDCMTAVSADERRCRSCGSPRLIRHPELHTLSIAHIDCDAFYAAIEKRDNPELADKPVIVGGGHRGVVSTCCYVARIRGVRSAMPMFKAMSLCPEAVVIKPDMAKYAAVGREVRQLMLDLTPAVEPLSIDEAFLDLTGTSRLHGMSPALSLAKLINTISEKIGITASVGLSANKFLAKIASDLEKPRGFSVLGQGEAREFLASQARSDSSGVSARPRRNSWPRAASRALPSCRRWTRPNSCGATATWARASITSRAARICAASRTDDHSKSISAETTFNEDITALAELEPILWTLAEKVSRRAKAEGVAGQTVVLKLKTRDFKIRTRNASLEEPTALATRIYETAAPLLKREATGTAFRLIGVGISNLSAARVEAEAETLDSHVAAQARAELAMDRLRGKFGRDAVARGIVLRGGKD